MLRYICVCVLVYVYVYTYIRRLLNIAMPFYLKWLRLNGLLSSNNYSAKSLLLSIISSSIKLSTGWLEYFLYEMYSINIWLMMNSLYTKFLAKHNLCHVITVQHQKIIQIVLLLPIWPLALWMIVCFNSCNLISVKTKLYCFI